MSIHAILLTLFVGFGYVLGETDSTNANGITLLDNSAKKVFLPWDSGDVEFKVIFGFVVVNCMVLTLC